MFRSVAVTASAPSAAEVARSVLAHASQVLLRAGTHEVEVHRHALTRHGVLLLLAPADTEPLAGGTGWWSEGQRARTVRLTATEVAPVPLADRVRGTVVLTGRLGPLTSPLAPEAEAHLRGPVSGGQVLRLVPRRISVEGRLVPGAHPVAVDPGQYLRAEPDPLRSQEGAWLTHLLADHADVLDALAGQTHGAPAGKVRPVALDAYGLVLRVGDRDVRFSFSAPVSCGCDLGPAFADLLDRELPEGPRVQCD